MKNIIFFTLLLTALTAQAQITITPTGDGRFVFEQLDFDTGDGWDPGRSKTMDTSSVVNVINGEIERLYREEARAYETLLRARTARLAYLAASPLVSQQTYWATLNARRDSTAYTGDFSMRVNGSQPFDITFQYRTPPLFNRILAADGTFLSLIRPQSPNSFIAVFQSTPEATALLGALAGQTIEIIRDGRRWVQPVQNVTRVTMTPR